MTLNKPSGWEDWINKVVCMDCLEGMKQMPPGVVHCVVTSPPYYGLRDYGTAKWEGGRADCDHSKRTSSKTESSTLQSASTNWNHEREGWVGGICGKCGAKCIDPQLGLEKTPEEYIAKMVEVFREVKRIMHPTGVLFLNMGDSYWGSGGPGGDFRDGKGGDTYGRQYDRVGCGLKPKDLLEMPSRLVLALQADGWWVRSRIPWLKRNAMPESCTDRPTQAVEYVFLLTKSAKCFYDGEAVRVKQTGTAHSKGKKLHPPIEDAGVGHKDWHKYTPDTALPFGRSRRNSDWFFESWQGLWTDENGWPLAFIVNPKPYKRSHFATFPPGLVIPCLKAGTSERGACPECGSPWVRVVEKSGKTTGKSWHNHGDDKFSGQSQSPRLNDPNYTSKTLGWRPTCDCGKEPVPCLVCDIFAGTGTVIEVARKMGRSGLGFEISEEYVKDFCKERLAQGVLNLKTEGA